MSEEKLVFVREAGQDEYDIMYLAETVQGPEGPVALTIEHLHMLVKEATGKASTEEVVKISANGIIVRNVNGIRFLLKSPEPKLEVTFASTQMPSAAPAVAPAPVGNQYGGVSPLVPVPVAPVYSHAGPSKWLTVLEKAPSSFGHSGTSINGQLLVFGGFANENTESHCLLLNDFSPNGKFNKLSVSGDTPWRRERHGAVLIGKRLYVFGGFEREGDRYFNDMWSFDTDTLSFQKIETHGNIPEGRCGHSTTLVDGKIWVFGGRVKVPLGSGIFSGTGLQYRNDLYCFDPATSEWTRYEPRGIGPSGRALHSANAIGHKIYIFGGANSSGQGDDTSGFCDLYELDIDTMTWSECETKGTPPTPCYGHSATVTPDETIFFFGGKGYQVLNSINIFDPKTKEWKQCAFAGNTLDCRWGHSSVLIGNQIVLYGGRDANGYHSSVKTIDLGKREKQEKQEKQETYFSRKGIN
eukprot:TRINITY_DN6095_c1_g1_i2.p1 TRINITY_DN6095_c1_g1~~TRINITY_DN6095_c1_g1_i2.p1  ORF type:complete len:468 (+),score=84.96 TRINITY_DN6095_c1_g1_i2:248-1651(+)